MSTLLTIFRRLLFRRRSTETKKSNESDKVKKRTKSLNLNTSTNYSNGGGENSGSGSFKRKLINVGRSESVVIRNRSQTESVTIERKHVHRSTERNPSRRNSYIIRPPVKSIQVTSSNQIAPSLTSAYSTSRIRSLSTSRSNPTVIHIKS